MEYSVGAAIGAGLVATAVMTAVLYMGIWMMPRQMTTNLLYTLGSVATPSRLAAYAIGAMMHAMMGVMFALVHTGLYQASDVESGLAA